MKIKCFSQNDWDNLQVVALGSFIHPKEVKRMFDSSYLSEFVNVVQKIADETYDDLNVIQETLEKHGVQVIRPNWKTVTEIQMEQSEKIKLNLNEKQTGYASDVFFDGLFIPISPRNDLMVYKDVVYTNGDNPAGLPLTMFDNKIVNARDHGYELLDWPCVTRVDDRLILGDGYESSAIPLLSNEFPDVEIVETGMAGHVDATLACIKPGVLLTTTRHPDYVYKKTFPDWQKYSVGKNGFHAMLHQMNTVPVHSQVDLIRRIESISNNNWWIEDFDKLPNSGEVGELINTYFSNWFGYSEETYFEINCLTINPDLTMAIGDNQDLAKILKQEHNHEVLHMQFRNRWFFDQGLHCLTTDLVRKA